MQLDRRENVMRFLRKIPERFIAPLEQEISLLRNEVGILKERLSSLQDRLTNYHHNRWDAIDCLADYLVNAEIAGDYAEFGVLGHHLRLHMQSVGRYFPEMRFLAFDSFQGLPDPKGIDKDMAGFSSGFFEGQFTCAEEDFLKNILESSSIARNRVLSTKGWFNETLLPETATKLSLNSLAAVWIDCDLYESTVPILRFITSHLSVGTVILFDDWRCFRNLPEFGQQRACSEWLEANPHIVLHDFITFGFHGKSFTVGKC